jgi:hypothetical protein
VAWIEHQIGSYAERWASDAPRPHVLVDVPVARLVAPNAASFPMPDGSTILALSSRTLDSPAPMTERGRVFLSLLAAHEGIPGHALHHWLGALGGNSDVHPAVADPYAIEGWAMAVEAAVSRLAHDGFRVVAAYHALRRFLPTTLRALRGDSTEESARSWLSSVLSRCDALVAEIADRSRFGCLNPQHYAHRVDDRPTLRGDPNATGSRSSRRESRTR